MVNWEVIVCKIISVIVCFFLPIYSQFIKYLFVSQPVPLHIPCFEHFGFIPKFTNPSVIELSVSRGVAGCLWSNVIKAGNMVINVFLLFKVTYFSASPPEDTKLRIFLYLLCIGIFLLGLGFIGIGEGQ